jgi:hypothetical protein
MDLTHGIAAIQTAFENISLAFGLASAAIVQAVNSITICGQWDASAGQEIGLAELAAICGGDGAALSNARFTSEGGFSLN